MCFLSYLDAGRHFPPKNTSQKSVEWMPASQVETLFSLGRRRRRRSEPWCGAVTTAFVESFCQSANQFRQALPKLWTGRSRRNQKHTDKSGKTNEKLLPKNPTTKCSSPLTSAPQAAAQQSRQRTPLARICFTM